MIYLKKFITHNEYDVYINGQNKILPNVSYCVDNNEVHYNKWIDPRLIVKFNVTSTSEAINIMDSGATSQFSKIEIDGVVQPSVVSSYTFDTTGEHTIKYTLVDPITGMPTTDSNKATMFYYIKGTEPNYDENLESLIPTIKEEKENDQ